MSKRSPLRNKKKCNRGEGIIQRDDKKEFPKFKNLSFPELKKFSNWKGRINENKQIQTWIDHSETSEHERKRETLKCYHRENYTSYKELKMIY